MPRSNIDPTILNATAPELTPKDAWNLLEMISEIRSYGIALDCMEDLDDEYAELQERLIPYAYKSLIPTDV